MRWNFSFENMDKFDMLPAIGSRGRTAPTTKLADGGEPLMNFAAPTLSSLSLADDRAQHMSCTALTGCLPL
jgi:hypothetical protein